MMTRVLLCGALALAAMLPPASADVADSFVIRGVRVFDGHTTHAVADVHVRSGLIHAMGRVEHLPDGTPIVDGRGKTLLPGLIDSHVHVFPGAAADAVRFGVTTVLDMFSAQGPQAAESFRAQRESLARVDAADVWTALYGITPPGGPPAALLKAMGVSMPTLDSQTDSAAFVAARLSEGSDYIKIFQDDTVVAGRPYEKFAPEQLREIIAAVHAHERRAIVHVSAREQARVALEAGADALAHLFTDTMADESLVALARHRKAHVIATLSVLAGAAGSQDAKALAAHAAVQPWLSQPQAEMLDSEFSQPTPEILDRVLGSVRSLHAAGVPFLAGTDAPNPSTAFGPSLHMELQLLVSAGLSPPEALTAATAAPAEFFGLSDRGRIAPGMRADLVLVEGDPTSDIRATLDIVSVWKNGFLIDRTPAPDHRNTREAGP
jgi:imidazolonepropionase-like amidohydrolase